MIDMAFTWGATAIVTLPNGETERKRILRIVADGRHEAKRLIEQQAQADFPEALTITIKNLNQHAY